MCVQTLVEQECESYVINLRSSDEISVKSVVSFLHVIWHIGWALITWHTVAFTVLNQSVWWGRKSADQDKLLKHEMRNSPPENKERPVLQMRDLPYTCRYTCFVWFHFLFTSLCLNPQVTVLNLQLDFKSSVTQQGEWITSEIMRYPSHYIVKPDRSIFAPLQVASPNVTVQAYRSVTAQHI